MAICRAEHSYPEHRNPKTMERDPSSSSSFSLYIFLPVEHPMPFNFPTSDSPSLKYVTRPCIIHIRGTFCGPGVLLRLSLNGRPQGPNFPISCWSGVSVGVFHIFACSFHYFLVCSPLYFLSSFLVCISYPFPPFFFPFFSVLLSWYDCFC